MFAPIKERLHIQKVMNIVLNREPFKIRENIFPYIIGYFSSSLIENVELA
ncbi:hypothetical protein KOY_03328 [Bacillus cereus VDM021]|nr:hypothetical protein IIW_01294 [Bacillus cereus VD136]EOP73246.1 hypothetical protein KOW_00656 [Bacillus cereus VDM006]EOQ09359.1 hypothetical protein KOY_03328 [Bacillus cereus VDM021]OOG93480.1 hypothetical protein BTH41_03473 [Bacillus mycoides]